jgi:predicted Na+-dependent transporter
MASQLFLVALGVVMLAQGMALHPSNLHIRGAGRPLALMLVLRVVCLPFLAMACGWIFELDAPLLMGLLLAIAAPPTVAALPLAGVAGAALPLLAVLIGVGTVAGLLFWALVVWGFPGQVVQDLLICAVLPFGAGLLLRHRGYGGGRVLPFLTSILTGAMIVAALLRGWEPGAWNAVPAALMLALATAVLALLTGRLMRLDPSQSLSLTFATLMSLVVLPIGLTAALDPAYAVPAALYGIAIYVVAIALMVLRLRRR